MSSAWTDYANGQLTKYVNGAGTKSVRDAQTNFVRGTKNKYARVKIQIRVWFTDQVCTRPNTNVVLGPSM